MSEAKSFKRWYERQPKLALAVKLLIKLPDEIRSILGDTMMLLANKEFEATKYIEGRSLGGEKVLGLYKSKNKRREYDQNETLHKAMNYLYILSEENQDFMADHILKLLEYVQKYFASCQEFKAEPSLEDVATIANMYVESGAADVELFLKNLRDEFYVSLLRNNNQKITAAIPATGEPEAEIKEKVTTQDDTTGMRIKKLDIG
jgi:hypothetical protein